MSALYMQPIAITMMAAARLAPKFTAKFGARAVCASGLLMMTVGFSVLAQLGTTSSDWLLYGGLLLLGAGMGAAMTPATSRLPITRRRSSRSATIGHAPNGHIEGRVALLGETPGRPFTSDSPETTPTFLDQAGRHVTARAVWGRRPGVVQPW